MALLYKIVLYQTVLIYYCIVGALNYSNCTSLDKRISTFQVLVYFVSINIKDNAYHQKYTVLIVY